MPSSHIIMNMNVQGISERSVKVIMMLVKLKIWILNIHVHYKGNATIWSFSRKLLVKANTFLCLKIIAFH